MSYIPKELYEKAAEHPSEEAHTLVALVDEEADEEDILSAKDDFLALLIASGEMTPEAVAALEEFGTEVLEEEDPDKPTDDDDDFDDPIPDIP